jgi:hypothetical protein
MNFRSVTINLLLTTLSGGVVLQTLEAQAASITFGAWNFTPAIVDRHTIFSYAYANSSVGRLEAVADTTPSPGLNPFSALDQYARATISLSSSFTVTPGLGEKNGDKVKGILSGSLIGILVDTAMDPTYAGTFNAQVNAEVDAGFASYRSAFVNKGTTSSISRGADDSRITVNDPFSVEGILTIGDTYAFNMKLAVDASKTNSIRAISNFRSDGRGFTANVQAVPEPLTMFGSVIGVGFGAFFKRKHSKNQKKS